VSKTTTVQALLWWLSTL